jgi:hypothetical protein
VVDVRHTVLGEHHAELLMGASSNIQARLRVGVVDLSFEVAALLEHRRAQACQAAVVVMPRAPRVALALARLLDRKVVQQTRLGRVRAANELLQRDAVELGEFLLNMLIALARNKNANIYHQLPERFERGLEGGKVLLGPDVW